MAIRKRDLIDQSGPGPHPLLLCDLCGETFSANASDYFQLQPDKELTCRCGAVGGMPHPLRLVRRVVRFVDVKLPQRGRAGR